MDEARWHSDFAPLFENDQKVKPIFMKDVAAQMSVSFSHQQIVELERLLIQSNLVYGPPGIANKFLSSFSVPNPCMIHKPPQF